MRIKNILILIIVIKILKSECSKGCLQCVNKECNICDGYNSYILKNKKCILQKKENCDKYFNGFCKKCISGYYIKNQTCLKIKNFVNIENCENYFDNGICSDCKNNFYLENKKCALIENKILNCIKNLNKKKCSICKKGYTLSLDKNFCIKNPEIKNCKVFSKIKCLSCKKTSISFLKFFKENIKKLSKSVLLKDKKEVLDLYLKKNIFYRENCIQTKIKNCLLFDNYKFCKKCKKNFFLKNGFCISNPIGFISKCLEYKKKNFCLKCKRNHFLKNPKNCVKNKFVLNCDVFSQVTNSTQCEKCFNNYFLKFENFCEKRIYDKILNCEEYDKKRDRCEKCENDFIISSDGRKCFQKIKNCKNYISSNFETEKIFCSICQNEFFLKNNFCIKGKIENCLIYDIYSEKCFQCKNKFFLNPINFQCNPHSQISNCLNYDNKINGLCKNCEKGSILFEKKTICKPVNKIQNCLKYKNISNCEKCKNGYNNIDKKKCIPLPLSSNCLYQENSICIICKENFYLKNNECFLPLKIGLDFCYKDKLFSNGDLVCDICKENSIPFNYKNQFFCITEENILNITKKNFLDSNCTAYIEKNQDEYVCTRCKENYFLEDNNCVAICNGSVKRTVLNIDEFNKIEFLTQNVCFSENENCEIFSLLKKQLNLPDVNYSCVKCKNNSFSKIDLNIHKEVLIYKKDFEISANPLLNGPYYYPFNSCILKNNQYIKSENSGINSFINNCKYYYNLLNNEIGCLTCNHKYNGIIKNWGVQNCRNYNNIEKVCSQCLNKFYISSNKLECITLPIINFCKWNLLNTENKCQICNVNYYLSNEKTCLELTNVQNCLKYSHGENKCVECKINYKFNNNKTICFLKIEKCLSYNNPLNLTDDVICLNCEDNYYPSLNKNSCLLGSVDYCWKYKQNEINKCLLYNNIIIFDEIKKCTDVNFMEGCKYYINVDDCEICNSGYYINNFICCENGKALNGNSCEDHLIENCKEGSDKSLCTKCYDGFNFDFYENDFTTQICCENGKYFNENDNICTKSIDLALNEKNCAVFDEDLWRCINCKDGYYINHLYKCCPQGKFYNINSLLEDKCELITQISDCLEIDISTTPISCIKCSNFNNLSQPISKFGTKCCRKDYQYLDNSQNCINNPSGCKNYDLTNSTCTICHEEYFISPSDTLKNCCKFKDNNNNNFIPLYFFNGNCTSGNAPSNCLKYDGINNICLECKNNYQLSEDFLRCCKINYVFNDHLCVKNSYLFLNCAKLNLINNICEVCEEGFYLHKNICVKEFKWLKSSNNSKTNINIEDCMELNSSDKCQKCKNDFILYNNNTRCCYNINSYQDPTNNICIPFKKMYENCAYFNPTTGKCEKCFGNFYTHANSQLCCEDSKKQNGETCSSNLSNCLQEDETGTCLKKTKKNTKHLCNFLTDQNCEKCEIGKILKADNSCEKISVIKEKCGKNSINHNCIKYNETTCVCEECAFWAHGINCCLYGYRFNLINKKCEQIENYCAIWDEINNECLECFFNLESNLVKKNFKWVFDDADYGGKSKDILELPNSSSDFYKGNDSKKCCKFGYYYFGKKCLKILIDYCLKYENNQCSLCKDEYFLVNSNLNCCKYNQTWDGVNNLCVDDPTVTACPLNYYESNSHCCLEKFYWDLFTEKCEPILDSNCLETNSSSDCIKCKTGLTTELIPYIIKLEIPNSPLFLGKSKLIKLYKCVDPSKFSVYAHFKAYNTKINCLIFDSENNHCFKCAENFYSIQGAKCCEENKASVVYNDKNDLIYHDGEKNYSYCFPIDNLRDNCSDYNITNRVCLSCKKGFNLSKGRCCTNGYFFDIKTESCSLNFTNCSIYSDENQNCIKCKENFYQCNGNCCSEGETYNSYTFLFSNSDSCLITGDNNNCFKANINYYLHREISCLEGFASVDQKCINLNPDLKNPTEFQNCLRFDFENNCIKCQTDFYLTNNRCCSEGFYFNIYIKECVSIYLYRNC